MNNLFKPFTRIAGLKALVYGLAGIIISAIVSYYSGWHAHGLLHFGPAAGNEWWQFSVERLVIWLVPSCIILIMSIVMSHSRIRAIDVFGTVAFAQLPLMASSLLTLSPGMVRLNTAMSSTDMNNLDVGQIISAVYTPSNIIILLLTVLLIVWMLVWIFDAVRVSCNLRNWKLWTVYATGVIVGDIVCRLVISLLY